MTDQVMHRKICFAVAPGYGTKVWGACDEVELTAGIKPSAVELACPRSEFSKLAGNYVRNGRIELYFSSDTTPDVCLYGWSIDNVKDSRFGIVLGESASSVVEQVITLTDRRWEFIDGRGGGVYLGAVNSAVGNAGAVCNTAEGILLKAGETYYQLLVRLIAMLQYASGGARLSSANLPEKPPLTSTKPANLKWDGAHVPTEFQRLLEGVECVWVLKTDGTYRVALIGDNTGADAMPSLPGANALPSLATKARSMRPANVIITSAPNRAIDQKTRGMIADDYYWEYVGVDEDGSVKGLAELSWGGGSLVNVIAYFRNSFRATGGFPALTVAQARLAEQTWFKMLRLRSQAANGYPSTQPVLPILNRTCQTAVDTGGNLRFLPAIVNAPLWYLDALQPGDAFAYLRNSPGPVNCCDFRVDHANGILIFDYPFGKLDCAQAAFTNLKEAFQFFTASDAVSITWSYPTKPVPTDPLNPLAIDPLGGFFSRAFVWSTLNASAVVYPNVSDMTDPYALDVRIYDAPELQEYRVEGVSVNGTALEFAATSIASRLLADSTAQTYRYQGFQNVSPSGNIASVRWSLRDGTTSFDWGGYYVSKNRWLDQKTFGIVKRDSDTAARSAVAMPAQVSDGGRDCASPYPVPYGRYNPQGGGPHGFFAKISMAGGSYTNELYQFVENICSNSSGDGTAQIAFSQAGTPRTGVASNMAELSSHSHLLEDGEVVWIGSTPDLQDPAVTHYWFDQPVKDFFPVLVTKTGGNPGDKTTQCSYVYSVTTLGGASLGINMTPVKARPRVGAMVAITSPNNIGVGYYAGSAFGLYDANEVIDPEAC